LATEAREEYSTKRDTGNDVERGLKLGFKAFKLSVSDGAPQGTEGKLRTVSRLKEARAASKAGIVSVTDAMSTSALSSAVSLRSIAPLTICAFGSCTAS
jgi:L-alanine-DL-glutamate epimerase-like enolase superfamily enzyme